MRDNENKYLCKFSERLTLAVDELITMWSLLVAAVGSEENESIRKWVQLTAFIVTDLGWQLMNRSQCVHQFNDSRESIEEYRGWMRMVCVCAPCACNRRWAWPPNGVRMKTQFAEHQNDNSHVVLQYSLAKDAVIAHLVGWIEWLTPAACFMNPPLVHVQTNALINFSIQYSLRLYRHRHRPSEPNIDEQVLRLHFRFD